MPSQARVGWKLHAVTDREERIFSSQIWVTIYPQSWKGLLSAADYLVQTIITGRT